jgi:hypothetical protein
MPKSRAVTHRQIMAFPAWIELPPGYVANDWIALEKGKLIAERLREDPALVGVAIERINATPGGMFFGTEEWLNLLMEKTPGEIAAILEAPDHEGQRLRSSSPFVREPFIKPGEVEAIRERAYLG